MVDLETLGRGPGCKLLSLGAVVFSPSGLGSEFYLEVQLERQGSLTADDETVAWWQTQDPAVRDRLFSSHEGKPYLAAALDQFSAWLESAAEVDHKGSLQVRVWGNGADFDNAILQVAYAAMSSRAPWPFWHNRCYRTLKALAPVIRFERQGSHHNALDDAKSQAAHAIKILNFLQAW